MTKFKQVLNLALALMAIITGITIWFIDFDNINVVTTILVMLLGSTLVGLGIYYLLVLGYGDLEDEPSAKRVDELDRYQLLCGLGATYSLSADELILYIDTANDVIEIYNQFEEGEISFNTKTNKIDRILDKTSAKLDELDALGE